MQEPENNPVTNFPRAALIFCYASLRFAPVVFRISQAEKSRSIRLLVAQCRVSVHALLDRALGRSFRTVKNLLGKNLSSPASRLFMRKPFEFEVFVGTADATQSAVY